MGLTIAAVGAGWWLFRSRSRRTISQADAEAFALSWAASYGSANGLAFIGRTRTVFFVGKPPGMPSADWVLVGGTPTRAFYYVEFSYAGNEWLTVMIDAKTGQKPLVSEGWVADTIANAFGL